MSRSYDDKRVADAIDAGADAALAEVRARANSASSAAAKHELVRLASDVHDAVVRAAVDVLRDLDDEAERVPSASSIRAATLHHFREGPGRELFEAAKRDLDLARRGRR